MSTPQPDTSEVWLGQSLSVDLDENPRLYVDLTTPYVPPPPPADDTGDDSSES